MSDTRSISAWVSFLIAVQFLTRFPVSWGIKIDDEQFPAALRSSLSFFPLVGFLIGCATGLVYCIALPFWSPIVASLIAVAVEMVLTGAFHEDALADSADALGGGWDREQILTILKDSRHGTYGVCSLVVGIGMRVALISSLSPELGLLSIPLSAGFGRWTILWMMIWVPPILDRPTMARDVGGQPSPAMIAWSSVWFSAGASGWILAVQSLNGGTNERALLSLTWLLPTVSLIVTLLFSGYVRKRVGGVTGDFLGSNCYLVQLATLLAFQFAVGT